MESIGTITIHYPYVDEKTREILQSVMPEAENFADFTKRLCDRVCTDDTPMLTQYLAFYFADVLFDFRLLDRLEAADRVTAMAEPLLFLIKDRRGQGITREDMKKALKQALDAAPNDWFVCHVYLTWRQWSAAVTSFTPADYGIHPFQSIIEGIEDNENLEYFNVYLLSIESDGLRKEFEYSKAYELEQQALQIAKKFDDRMAVADKTLALGYLAKFSDVREASNLVIKSRTLYEELGDTLGVGSSLLMMSHVMAYRGELNAAVEYVRDYANVRESLSLPSDLQMCMVAFYHNHMGNGKAAWEILTNLNVHDQSPITIRVSYHSQKSWALLICHRQDKAKYEFEQAKMAISELGELEHLVLGEILEGLIEKTEGELDGAIDALKRALEAVENGPAPMYLKNLCLLHLTDIEVEKYDYGALDSKEDVSGPWMQMLEAHVKKNDLPGIESWSKILKAKFRRKQGREDDVKSLLDDVLDAANSSSMRYLKDIVKDTFLDY